MDPNNVESLYELSGWTDDPGQQESLLRAVLKAQPENQDARRDLAMVVLALGRFDRAAKEVLSYLSATPLHERQSLNDAVVFGDDLADAGHVEDAVRLYQLASTRPKE